MSRFFTEIKKKDGDHYEPTTLTSFQRGLQRYLNDHGFSSRYSETTAVFLVPRGPLLKKKAVITRFWQENTPTSRSSLADAEEDLMFKRGGIWQQTP